MNIRQFIVSMLSSDNAVSSKRIAGIACIGLYIIFIILNFFISLSETQVRMLETLLYIGAGLLGLGLLDRIKSFNEKDTNESK